MKNGKSIIKTAAALIPSVVLIIILISQFPYTGLSRIISIPMILVINILIIALGLACSLRVGQRYLYVMWGGIIIVTLAITLLLYPQEKGPNIMMQLWKELSR